MNGQGQLRGTLNISERPAEANDRAVPGHWEGDLLFGKRMHAMATLVERKTRFVMLDRAARRSRRRRASPTRSPPRSPSCPNSCVVRSPGIKARRWPTHARFSIDTGVPVYFCDPRSPWQRGSNENTNGLLRQYFPKRTEPRALTPSRPRRRRRRTQRPPSTNPRLAVTITSTRRSVAMTT